jgi:hypothetical protein
LAYALSIFNEATYSDLKVIKQIRDMFAHPQGSISHALSFEHSELVEVCKKFKNFDASKPEAKQFERKVYRCIVELSKVQEDIEKAAELLAQMDAEEAAV